MKHKNVLQLRYLLIHFFFKFNELYFINIYKLKHLNTIVYFGDLGADIRKRVKGSKMCNLLWLAQIATWWQIFVHMKLTADIHRSVGIFLLEERRLSCHESLCFMLLIMFYTSKLF
jgi:hypothetical protein